MSTELILLGANATTMLALAGLYYKLAKVEARLELFESNITTRLEFKRQVSGRHIS